MTQDLKNKGHVISGGFFHLWNRILTSPKAKKTIKYAPERLPQTLKPKNNSLCRHPLQWLLSKSTPTQKQHKKNWRNKKKTCHGSKTTAGELGKYKSCPSPWKSRRHDSNSYSLKREQLREGPPPEALVGPKKVKPLELGKNWVVYHIPHYGSFSRGWFPGLRIYRVLTHNLLKKA